MTNKEAIQILRSIRVYDIYPKSASEETKQALDMAIKALEERPTGEWLEVGKYQFECDQCHYDDCAVKTNYCPNCGARMKGEKK